MSDNTYVYFLFSTEHVAKMNEVQSKLGKRFVCGTVVSNGVKKKYSYMGTNKSNFFQLYPDAKLVMEGDKDQIQYTETTTDMKRGN